MTILFYPEAITPDCKLYHTMKRCGVDFHNDIEQPYDVAIYWSYHKATAAHVIPHTFLNYGCTDVSKSRIDAHFDSINVNPEKYSGLVVRKTEEQCSLNETVICCPAERESGYVYRRLIDTIESGCPTDLRVFYFDGSMFIVKKVYTGAMFDRHNYRWEQVPIDVIHKQKRADIVKKCRSFGFHIGEIDVLKDNKTGECYVIDINNVSGIAYSWNYSEYWWLRDAFDAMFLAWCRK